MKGRDFSRELNYSEAAVEFLGFLGMISGPWKGLPLDAGIAKA